MVLSEDGDPIRGVIVVPPTPNPMEGVTVEVFLGATEWLGAEGVVRAALPRPGFLPCSWLVALSTVDLIERAAVLSPEKLGEVEDVLRRGGLA